jgi:hypothetical protein
VHKRVEARSANEEEQPCGLCYLAIYFANIIAIYLANILGIYLAIYLANILGIYLANYLYGY